MRLLLLVLSLLLISACSEEKEAPTCDEACEEIVAEYGDCREDINGPESCTSFCEDEEGKKEVKRVHECLDEHSFSCDAFSDECDSEIFIRIVVENDDVPSSAGPQDEIMHASCVADR